MEPKSSRSGRQTTRHSIYVGVRQRKSGKWVSEIRDPNTRSRIWLGTFENPEMAAKAHDVAMLALHGDNARLNFPGSAHRLPRAESCSHEDIQRAALKVATDFSDASSLSSSTFSSNVDVSGSGSEVEFVDEETMFNMPLMMDCMAEAMLLTPPALKKGFNWSQDDDDVDVTLWEE